MLEPRRHLGGWTAIEGLPILLVIIGIVMITAPSSFLGPRISMSFLATVPPALILGLGLTLVIAAGEIDLSFPSVVKMSGITFALLTKFAAFPLDAGEDMIIGPARRATCCPGCSRSRPCWSAPRWASSTASWWR